MDKSKWEYKKLGDCFVYIKNGANIKQVNGATGIPITRIETLSNDVFNRDRMGYANIDDVSPYSSNILNDGDILMSHINSMKHLGKVAYCNNDMDVIHGMNLLNIRVDPNKIYPNKMNKEKSLFFFFIKNHIYYIIR